MQRKQLGAAAGNEKLGCSLYEVPPGCRSWPYHYHYANEEAIYVLEGRGTLRLAGEEIAISSGDYIAFPAGESSAHQMINTSDAPFPPEEYLFSNRPRSDRSFLLSKIDEYKYSASASTQLHLPMQDFVLATRINLYAKTNIAKT